ncbi:hypothetical protein [Streptomyces marispadix]|uniref:Uncharacterized protein n=1 Tax=Streptomyces marispadix TaxID=2922868 RepID=A0ABS9SZN5_9ACTN|nr:hypothetical protein [Streptomyces marispadix]MCH6161724.1 hypothetical protein [Streptomyces marispadix]
MSVEHDWDAGGAWLLVAFLAALPVVLDLSEPPAARHGAELRLSAEYIETVTSRGRTVSLPWADVAEVAVRGEEPAGAPGRAALHVRLRPEVTPAPAPGPRPDGAGWIALWPLGGGTAGSGAGGSGAVGEIPPGLREALDRFAGERWTGARP